MDKWEGALILSVRHQTSWRPTHFHVLLAHQTWLELCWRERHYDNGWLPRVSQAFSYFLCDNRCLPLPGLVQQRRASRVIWGNVQVANFFANILLYLQEHYMSRLLAVSMVCRPFEGGSTEGICRDNGPYPTEEGR